MQEKEQPAPPTRSLALKSLQPVRSDATGERRYADGQATLTDTTEGVSVDLSVQSLPGVTGFRYPAKTRRGLCFKESPDPPVQADLKPVEIGTDGTAQSTTLLSDQTMAGLLRGNSSISVEVEQAAWFTSPRISCAELVS